MVSNFEPIHQSHHNLINKIIEPFRWKIQEFFSSIAHFKYPYVGLYSYHTQYDEI